MKRWLKSTALVLSLALLALPMAACGNGKTGGEAKPSEAASGGAEGGKTFKIGIMPKLMGIPYFEQTGEGAIKAGKDLGVDVVYNGPTKADAAEQVKMMEDWINSGVNAIAIAPNDSAAVAPAIKKAKDAGIIVLDWDTPSGSPDISASVHQIDDKVLGEQLFDNLVKAMGTDSADYAIVTGGLSAENLNTWIDYGTEYAKTKYPNLKLVTDKIPSDEQQQLAYTKTLDLLKAYPSIKGIIGYSTVAPLGVAQAVREKGLQDKVAVVGTAVEGDSKDFLSDGSLDVATLWNTQNLGYLTVGVAKALLEGQKLENGMEIQGFGKIEVKEDGKTVIMGPPDNYVKQ